MALENAIKTEIENMFVVIKTYRHQMTDGSTCTLRLAAAPFASTPTAAAPAVATAAFAAAEPGGGGYTS